ncbi:MAG: ATP-dependent acyl-CoA ligase [Gammaproteobacteria bacterium]|nr:MAG: ATP-dependent acyl-CoA ligase [Gammaproteobacteria bacterium]
MADSVVFSNMIAARAKGSCDFNALTFVSVNSDNELHEEVRSYSTLQSNGQRMASALIDIGMEKGDSFALVMQNHPEFVDAMVASSICGTVFVPLDPRTKGEKLAYMLGFAECRGAIVADYALGAVLAVVEQTPSLEWLWVVSTGVATDFSNSPIPVTWLSDIPPQPAGELPSAVAHPDEAMQMLFTSGTTGDPKAIVASYAKFDNVASIGPLLGLNDSDCLYTGLSLTHANAQLITLGNALKMGLPCVISRKFTKSRLWDICRRYGCTFFNLLGGMTTAIYSESERPSDADNPVKMVLSAGMPVAIWDDFSCRFDLQVFEFYGAAEGGMTFNAPGCGPVGSIGKPPPNLEAKIVDENDVACPPHVQGEIVFRNIDGSSPTVIYYKNPLASREKTRGGWLRMGDVGHTDDEGWFYFDYRQGGGIRHNGDFINASFVEKAISKYSEVDDVFVYGVEAASAVPGEKDVVAIVVPVPGTEIDIASIYRHCREQLESNFVPGFIQVMKEIPKTASEKPQERFCLDFFREHPETVYTEPKL